MSARIRSLNDFLALLHGVKKAHDGGYLALCPGHHDTKPSLSIKEIDGKILLQCFAGCELADILKPLGLLEYLAMLTMSPETRRGKG